MARYRVTRGNSVSLSAEFPERGLSVVMANEGDVFSGFRISKERLERLIDQNKIEPADASTPISITLGQSVVLAAIAAERTAAKAR